MHSILSYQHQSRVIPLGGIILCEEAGGPVRVKVYLKSERSGRLPGWMLHNDLL